jgi:hypothetical protein
VRRVDGRARPGAAEFAARRGADDDLGRETGLRGPDEVVRRGRRTASGRRLPRQKVRRGIDGQHVAVGALRESQRRPAGATNDEVAGGRHRVHEAGASAGADVAGQDVRDDPASARRLDVDEHDVAHRGRVLGERDALRGCRSALEEHRGRARVAVDAVHDADDALIGLLIEDVEDGRLDQLAERRHVLPAPLTHGCAAPRRWRA